MYNAIRFDGFSRSHEIHNSFTELDSNVFHSFANFQELPMTQSPLLMDIRDDELKCTCNRNTDTN